MNHVMLDIETLGDESGSIITSIGAVQFDPQNGQTGKTFHRYINIQTAHNAGLKMNPSTILWWLEQSDEARRELLNGNRKGLDIKDVLIEFSQWLKIELNTVFYVWGRGPRFDMGILADAYRKINIAIPWDTRKELCVRTMEFINPEIKKDTTPVDSGHGSEGMGTHNALLDCYFQIKYVSNIYHYSIKKSKV